MGFDTEEKRVQPLWQFHQVVDEVSSSDFEDIFRSITSDDRPFWHNWELAEENTSTDVSWKNHSTFLDALSQEHGGPIIVFQKFFGDYVIRVTLDTLLEYVSLVEIAIIRYDFIYVIGSADFNPPNDDDEVDMTPILPPDPREKILQPV